MTWLNDLLGEFHMDDVESVTGRDRRAHPKVLFLKSRQSF